MERIVHDLEQGSAEWEAFRFEHNGASEAAIMLNISPYATRNEMLHVKHTGIAKTFSDWVQEHILDYGHQVEAMARPIVEEYLGEDLYPVTYSYGRVSASCDGLTLAGKKAFEHKQWSESLAESIRNGVLPGHHVPQCQQVMYVTGAQELIFVVSDGTKDKFEFMHVYPDTDYVKKIIAGWGQFNKDLEAYVPRDIIEKPVANEPMQLPALAISIRGEVALSNLPEFKIAAEAFISNVRTDLETDQDFSDAEATTKFFADAEKKLEAAKESALAQTADIDLVMKTIDFIKDAMRTKRLTLEKLVEAKKKAIKEKIMADAVKNFNDHVAALEAEIYPAKLKVSRPDFALAMKNKRTIVSLHNGVDSALAEAKMSADAIALTVRTNITWAKEQAGSYYLMITDIWNLAHKQEDDFQLSVNALISRFKSIEAESIARAEIEAKAKENSVQAPQLFVNPQVVTTSTGAGDISKTVASSSSILNNIRPTRKQIIRAVSELFRLSMEDAEKAIIDEFSISQQQAA